MKHGGGGLMVWGCFSVASVGELVFIGCIMDKSVYLNILKENLKKSAEKLNLPSFTTPPTVSLPQSHLAIIGSAGLKSEKTQHIQQSTAQKALLDE